MSVTCCHWTTPSNFCEIETKLPGCIYLSHVCVIMLFCFKFFEKKHRNNMRCKTRKDVVEHRDHRPVCDGDVIGPSTQLPQRHLVVSPDLVKLFLLCTNAVRCVQSSQPHYLRHLHGVMFFSPVCLFVCLFVYLSVSRISPEVVDGFGWDLVERLGVWKGRNDSVLVKILIRILELSIHI